MNSRNEGRACAVANSASPDVKLKSQNQKRCPEGSERTQAAAANYYLFKVVY